MELDSYLEYKTDSSHKYNLKEKFFEVPLQVKAALRLCFTPVT